MVFFFFHSLKSLLFDFGYKNVVIPALIPPSILYSRPPIAVISPFKLISPVMPILFLIGFFAFLEKSKTKTLNFSNIFLGPKKNFINKKENKDNFFSKINVTNDFIIDAVTKLINGEIIASYYGSNEVGPRSLGNTSIFCDAKNKESVINLNLNLKKRGHFQPLAPILLEEDFEKYFSINKSIVKNLEWMGTLCDAKEGLYNKYSSIIHVDGTCRAHIIKDENSLTYKVLKNLKENGSDILVNTSFNISKDPVVFDLYDVYVNMKRMNIKFVLMDDGLYQTKDI